MSILGKSLILLLLLALFTPISLQASFNEHKEDEVSLNKEDVDISWIDEFFSAVEGYKPAASASLGEIPSTEPASSASSTQLSARESAISVADLVAHPCFSAASDLIFALTFALHPDFRSPSSYRVETMQDLKYIFLVLKPSIGILYHYFRFEYDLEALRADCRTEEDLNLLAELTRQIE